MQITAEGKLGLCLGLIALAGAGAMMVAPDKLWIGWTLIALAGLGGIGLGFHHLGPKFAAIFLVAGVLWFDYWYYSSVLNSTETPKLVSGQNSQRHPKFRDHKSCRDWTSLFLLATCLLPMSKLLQNFPRRKRS